MKERGAKIKQMASGVHSGIWKGIIEEIAIKIGEIILRGLSSS
jgi:hypothetical protein